MGRRFKLVALTRRNLSVENGRPVVLVFISIIETPSFRLDLAIA